MSTATRCCLIDYRASLPVHWGKDEVVLLGDLADRGPASHQVIARMMSLCAQYPQVTVLRGNHEEMLLQRSRPGLRFTSGSRWAATRPIGHIARQRAICAGICLCVRCRQSPRLSGGDAVLVSQRRCQPLMHAGAKRDEAGRWALADQQAALWSRDPTFSAHMMGRCWWSATHPPRSSEACLARLRLEGPPQAWSVSC